MAIQPKITNVADSRCIFGLLHMWYTMQIAKTQTQYTPVDGLDVVGKCLLLVWPHCAQLYSPTTSNCAFSFYFRFSFYFHFLCVYVCTCVFSGMNYKNNSRPQTRSSQSVLRVERLPNQLSSRNVVRSQNKQRIDTTINYLFDSYGPGTVWPSSSKIRILVLSPLNFVCIDSS